MKVLEFQHKNTNLMISPFSILSVMSLILTGADKQAATELDMVLSLPSKSHLLKFVQDEVLLLLQKAASYKLKLLNLIHVNTISSKNGSEVTYTTSKISDLMTTDDQKTSALGLWLEKNHMLDSPLVKAILATRVTFEGIWKHEFIVVLDEFISISGNSEDIRMFDTRAHFNYYYDKAAEVAYLEIPLVGSDVLLMMILPDKKDQLFKLEQDVSIFDLEILPRQNVHVRFPAKFTHPLDYNVKSVLQELGVKSIFSEESAFAQRFNFNLSVTGIYQVPELHIYTTGLSASSESVADFDRKRKRSADVEFVANRPFLYVLRHRVLGALFVGRYVSPE